MKKKIIKSVKIIGIIIGALLLFLNVSSTLRIKSDKIKTFNMTSIIEANAECISPGPSTNGFGKCNEGYDICYWTGVDAECDLAY